MHVLITSDTVGGVWTYTQELVTGLIEAGHRVTLVSFGKLPLPHQTGWMEAVPELDYRPTEYQLEWMETAEKDVEESKHYLERLVRETEPDILNLSQYCYGDIAVDVPKVVIAHSDVVSWWVAVHGTEPEDTPWIRNYREMVSAGLQCADVVVAPSQWMLQAISKYYSAPSSGTVIHNGRSPGLFDPDNAKQDYVLSVGRLWDAGKQISLLLQDEQDAPILIAGWEREPGRGPATSATPVPANVRLLGAKPQSQLRDLYSRAALYAATSRYEPFGLSPLEAALSRCALVLNDLPVFHELWGDAGQYFEKNNAAGLARVIAKLRRDSEKLRQQGHRAYQRALDNFSARRMVAEYETLYREVTMPARAA